MGDIVTKLKSYLGLKRKSDCNVDDFIWKRIYDLSLIKVQLQPISFYMKQRAGVVKTAIKYFIWVKDSVLKRIVYTNLKERLIDIRILLFQLVERYLLKKV